MVLKWLLAFVVLMVALYGGVLVWFSVNENSLVFRPERGKIHPASKELALESLDITIESSDSVLLVARLIPPPQTALPTSAPWILYFHGASGNVGTAGYNEAWAKFRRLGFGVLAVDYRGYGQSAGEPSEAGLYRDADAAYAHLTQHLRVAPSRIVIYGYSLGSAVAIDLASRAKAAGLIVEGAFLSIPDRGAELYPYLPVHWLANNRFASVDKVTRVAMPKLFIHALEDKDVPIAHGQRLFQLARAPKFFETVAGGHATAFQVDPEFFSAVTRFTQGLRLTPPRGPSP